MEEIENRFINFAKKVREMVGTNESAYATSISKRILSSTETAEDIAQLIADGSAEQIISLSEKYLGTSGLYQRIISYFSTFLTNDILIAPKKITIKTIKANKYLENYKKATFFADTVVNPKLNFPRMTFKMLVYGAYYGLFLEKSETEIVFKDLPIKYCRSRYKTHQNINILEFDMAYFDAISDNLLREQALAEFPKEFTKAYNDYKKDTTNFRWHMVAPEIGVAFYYQDQYKPYFISMIPAVANLDEYKSIEKDLDKQELEHILVQKIPMDKEGNFLLSIDETVELHKGVTDMLVNSPRIDVLTTFAEVDLHALGSKTATDRDNLEKIERSVYNEAGVSPLLFGTDSSTAIKMSILNDMSLVLDMQEQYVNWVAYQTNMRYGENNKYYFEVSLLPISHYNREDMLDIYLKTAQYGYSKILVSIVTGVKQSSLPDLIELETDILMLHEKMIPLQSSHTTSEKPTQDSGRPTKPLSQKADQTIKNEESM